MLSSDMINNATAGLPWLTTAEPEGEEITTSKLKENLGSMRYFVTPCVP